MHIIDLGNSILTFGKYDTRIELNRSRFGSRKQRDMRFMIVFMSIAILGVITTSFSNRSNFNVNISFSKRSKCVNATASLQNDKVLFRITMSNDYGTGYYALKRRNNKDEVELIECREIRNGESLRTYEFEDYDEMVHDCQYSITRVDVLKQESEVVKRWQYNDTDKRLIEIKR